MASQAEKGKAFRALHQRDEAFNHPKSVGRVARTPPGVFLRAAREMQASGTFTFAQDAVNYAEINTLLA